VRKGWEMVTAAARVKEKDALGLDGWTKRFVVITSVSVSSIIALTVIVVVAVFTFVKPTSEIPKVLENWGGLIIGFYFGSFITLLKDWSREAIDAVRVARGEAIEEKRGEAIEQK
jgi:hypothetical protein